MKMKKFQIIGIRSNFDQNLATLCTNGCREAIDEAQRLRVPGALMRDDDGDTLLPVAPDAANRPWSIDEPDWRDRRRFGPLRLNSHLYGNDIKRLQADK